MMVSRRIAVVGAGAVGLAVAGNLIEAGHHVTLVARGKVGAVINRTGFFLNDAGMADSTAAYKPGKDGDFVMAQPMEPQFPRDVVVIATKEDDFMHAFTETLRAGFVGPKTIVLPALNGIPPWFPYKQENVLPYVTFQNEQRFDQFAKNVPINQVFGVRIGFAAVKLAANYVLRSARGTVEIGQIYDGQDSSGKLQLLLEDLSSQKCRFKLSLHIREAIWEKLALNAFVNAWARYGWPIERVAKHPQLKWGWKLADELHRLGKTLGVVNQEASGLRLYLASCLNSEHARWHTASTWSDVTQLKKPEFFPLYASPLLYLSAVNRLRATCRATAPLSSYYLRNTYRIAVRGYLSFALQFEAHLRQIRAGSAPEIISGEDSAADQVRKDYLETMKVAGLAGLPKARTLEKICPAFTEPPPVFHSKHVELMP